MACLVPVAESETHPSNSLAFMYTSAPYIVTRFPMLTRLCAIPVTFARDSMCPAKAVIFELAIADTFIPEFCGSQLETMSRSSYALLSAFVMFSVSVRFSVTSLVA